MIIGDKVTTSVSQPYARRVQAPKMSAASSDDPARIGVSGEDEVEISAKALLLQKATEQAISAEDIRWDKVDDLRQRIAQGTYALPFTGLAGRLLHDT